MRNTRSIRTKSLLAGLSLITLLSFCTMAWGQAPASGEMQWYKGNTHCHTWWSDGDSPPEIVAAWYKKNGYNFVVISDHNTLSEGERWYTPGERKENAIIVAKQYEDLYGPDWIEKKTQKKQTQYRLKTLDEYRTLFEEPGKFLLIPGEEITAVAGNGKPVHVNGVNLRNTIPPLKGDSIMETIQLNVNAVSIQEAEIQRPMLAHLNHFNFHNAISAEDAMMITGLKFIEMFDDLPAKPEDENNFSSERAWDIILTKRLAELSLPIIYGIGTDDRHGFAQNGPGSGNPGGRWVMVRAKFLTPAHIVQALERGDYYATTGVILDKLSFENNTLKIDIQTTPGVTYKTQFIGTLKDYDQTVTDIANAPNPNYKHRYSKDVGKILDEQTGAHAEYTMTGKELYVRTKISAWTANPGSGEPARKIVAWIQPVQSIKQ